MNQTMIDKLERWGAERKALGGREFLVFRPGNVGRTSKNVAGLKSESADERLAALKAIRAAAREYEAEIGYKYDFDRSITTLGGKTYTGKDATRMAGTYRELEMIRYDIENDSLEAAYVTVNDFHRAILTAICNA